MSASRLEEALTKIGPVMGQLFGQSEAPMMISTLAPAEHFRDDGSVATERLSSAGRPTPLTTVAIMDDEGHLLGPGERGEIVVRGSLVMAGYYKNPEATADAARHGWHHTGDIGYLDEDGYLFIVDRAKDMIITGGFNVYSAEVEQVLLAHPAVQDCAVIGLPDEKWGERVTAVVQLRPGQAVTEDEIRAFVKDRLGSVKAPKQVEVWPDLPRSKVGKVLKVEVKAAVPLVPNGPGACPRAGSSAAPGAERLAQLRRDRAPPALVRVDLTGRKLLVLDGQSMRSAPPTAGSSAILTARAGRGHIHSVMPSGSSHSSNTTCGGAGSTRRTTATRGPVTAGRRVGSGAPAWRPARPRAATRTIPAPRSTPRPAGTRPSAPSANDPGRAPRARSARPPRARPRAGPPPRTTSAAGLPCR